MIVPSTDGDHQSAGVELADNFGELLFRLSIIQLSPSLVEDHLENSQQVFDIG